MHIDRSGIFTNFISPALVNRDLIIGETMKQTKNEIIKPIFYRNTTILTLLILGSFWAFLTTAPLAFSQPSRDMSRYNAMKRIPLTERKTWTFNTSAGPIRFQYSDNGGVAEFTPNSSVGRASIAWIQVVRTGGKDRWYVTEADLMRLSKNKVNYVQRTDGVYGFRVDKTKGENTPFWEQTPLKS